MPRVDQEDQTLDGDELAVVPPSRPAEEPAATAQPNEFMYVQRECPPPRFLLARFLRCGHNLLLLRCPGDTALNPARASMSPDPATKKVTRRKETDVAADRAAAARERAMEAAEAGKPPKQVAVETLSRLLTTAFFFGQGILGGMSVLILILLLVSAPSPAEFLHFYSPVSRYIHGLLFWLTSFCILGAVDKLAKDQIRGWRPGSPAVSTSAVKYRDVLVLSLYGISFILTLINAEVDLRFQYSESRHPSWYKEAEPPAAFVAAMSTWHGLNVLRLLLLVAAHLVLLTDSQMGNDSQLAPPPDDGIVLGEDASGPPVRKPARPAPIPSAACAFARLR